MDDNATEETRFARLVSLACHDLRTPLATVVGFAHTLTRQGELEEPAAEVRGAHLQLPPVTKSSAPVLLGDELRDLGAAVAGIAIRAQGGSLELDGETLTIRLG